jgi:hypothetical protein
MKFFWVDISHSGFLCIKDQDDVKVLDFIENQNLAQRMAFRMNTRMGEA